MPKPSLNLPDDEQALARLYNETLEQHQTFLERLQAAFNRRCDEIGAETKKKLAEIGETDEEARQRAMAEEKELLDKTLSELKFAINKSNSNAMKKLEEIQERLDSRDLNLEKALAEV